MKNAPIALPKANELIKGTVIGQEGSMLFVDLSPFRTGVIYGREFNNAKEIIKSLKKGDEITAKILDLETHHGYVDLSLKEAAMDIVWREAEALQKSKESLNITVTDANPGGLVLDWRGAQGFLPASQLKMENYPRVQDGDKNKIMEELKKLVGKPMKVIIISADQKNDKLIFSEKGTAFEDIKDKIAEYNVGDIIEGNVTGIVDFGIFIKIAENLEGLAHISELAWTLIGNPAELFKVGQEVKAQIISIVDGKISLSLKALLENPWDDAKEKHKKDDIVEGVVIKHNRHGALASIQEGVAGLVHISEFASEEEMKQKYEIGKSYSFKITLFEPKEQRLILVPGDKKTETDKKPEVEK